MAAGAPSWRGWARRARACRRGSLRGLLVLVSSLLACAARVEPTQVEAGRFGTVALYAPDAEPEALVFLFSDATGPSPELERVAQELAAQGVASLLVDLSAYLPRLAASDDGCHYLVSEVEELSKREQHALGSEGYRSPILAGVGQGGTLAYAALAQAPAATLGGAVALDPAPALGTRVPLCAGARALPSPGGGFRYAAPEQALPGVLRIAARAKDPELEHWRELVRADAEAALAVTEGEGEGDGLRLLEALRAVLVATGPPRTPALELAKLPLVEVPAAKPGPLFAVIYSGDGGWRDLDKTLGEFLAEQGVSTVGVDSLRYFWRRRSPEEVASDLAEILSSHRARFGAEQAILIGYSFGAGILPFAWNRLAPAERAGVVQLTLLGLGSRAEFEFHLSGWVRSADASGLPVLPEIVRMDLARVQCVYGIDEEDTLCPRPELQGAEVIRKTGGHHFDGDYRRLGQQILDGARRRLATHTGAVQ